MLLAHEIAIHIYAPHYYLWTRYAVISFCCGVDPHPVCRWIAHIFLSSNLPARWIFHCVHQNSLSGLMVRSACRRSQNYLFRSHTNLQLHHCGNLKRKKNARGKREKRKIVWIIKREEEIKLFLNKNGKFMRVKNSAHVMLISCLQLLCISIFEVPSKGKSHR